MRPARGTRNEDSRNVLLPNLPPAPDWVLLVPSGADQPEPRGSQVRHDPARAPDVENLGPKVTELVYMSPELGSSSGSRSSQKHQLLK